MTHCAHLTFAEIAGIPLQQEPENAASGFCQPNIDGACIRGGSRVAGLSGYGLAGMGAPANACAAFPLFFAGNRPYTQMGWSASTNLNPLLIGVPQL